jgi:pimeloyl-ACP methyl ester carboxylesterase
MARANGLDICVQHYALASGPSPQKSPVLLIMGLGMQGIAWPVRLIDGLRGQGHEVATFDNRDIGLSSKLPSWGKPNIAWAAMKHAMGWSVKAAYSLEDMALDTLGVLDALGWSRAHVIGVSMGGMITQLLAAHYPQRLVSATLIMTSSGSRKLPQSNPKARMALLSRPPQGATIDQLETHSLNIVQVIGSSAYPQPQHEVRARIRRGLQRSYHPLGVGRQLMAIVASGSRSKLLETITLPVAVIHGEDDPLVPVAHGHDLAKRIPHARVRFVPGMGHDLPPEVCDIVLEEAFALFDGYGVTGRTH